MNWPALNRWFAARSLDGLPLSKPVTVWTGTTLQERYLSDVFRFVRRRLTRQEDAEDATAEVFAAALEALPKRRGDDDPRLWLFGIARRKVADVLRRQSRRRETLATEMPSGAEPAQSSGLQADLERQEETRELRRLVDALKPDQRDALLMHYLEDLSIVEIATVMRRSPAAVNSLLQRARASVYRAGQGYFLEEDGGNR